MSLSAEVRDYLADSYPHNHDYLVKGGELKPRWKLKRRWRRLERLWPERFGSFLDIGSSKGFFVLEAARRGAEALGVDIHEGDLAAADAVRDHLGLDKARFKQKTLDELAAEGARFDLVHLVNTYHYLYFGSDRAPACAADHRVLFEHLATVTEGALIFSNCETIERCPAQVRERARPEDAARYNPEELREAANEHFVIEEHRRLGKRPLWVGRRR